MITLPTAEKCADVSILNTESRIQKAYTVNIYYYKSLATIELVLF